MQVCGYTVPKDSMVIVSLDLMTARDTVALEKAPLGECCVDACVGHFYVAIVSAVRALVVVVQKLACATGGVDMCKCVE